MDRDSENSVQSEPENSGNTPTSAETRKEEIEFILLIRGRNCAKEVGKCIRSIRRQTYTNWRAFISLDGPDIESFNVAKGEIKDDNRFDLKNYYNHKGVCGNMYRIIVRTGEEILPDEESVAVIIDADDFITKDALETVAKVYRKYPDTLITHGSYLKMSKRKRTKISSPNPKKGNIRKLPWRSSHLKTIKWKVIRRAEPSWFQHKGKWLQAASDLALMFPCIEIAGLHRVRHIHKVIYYWNDHVTKAKRKLEKKCEKIVRAKKL